MLYKETRILEFNREALRVLMSAFYRSSANAWTLYNNIADYKRDEERHYEAHFARKKAEADRRNWDNELSGNVKWKSISKTEVIAQAKQAFEIALRDQSEVFFSRLSTFAQDQFMSHRRGTPSALFDGPLKGITVKDLLEQLKDPELRREILDSYFPGRPHYVSRHTADKTKALSILAPFMKAKDLAQLGPQIEAPGLMPQSNVITVDFSQQAPPPEGPPPPVVRVA